jgi:Holliday junction resolvasome RuvABC endonuclease subunit
VIFGIDPSSKTIAVARWDDGIVLSVDKWTFRKGTKAWQPEDARQAHLVIHGVINDLMDAGAWDDVTVYLEAPVMGRSVKPTIVQSYVSGIIQAVATAVADVELVNNKTWKRVIVGNGNASKADTKRYFRKVYPELARRCGDDDDLFDACGLALYGAATEWG